MTDTEPITIAITSDTGKWEFISFDNWDAAREAVNAARRQGKKAVVYDGQSLPYPPELMDTDLDK